MIRSIVDRLPAEVIRAVGRAQFKSPFLHRVVTRAARGMTAGERTVVRGVGKGLRFDATGSYPGYIMGTSDAAEQKLLSRALHAGSVFYDVGAHVGFFSTIAGRLVGASGAVYAFEPSEDAAKAAANAQRNAFDHVHIVQAAVADFDGRMRFRTDVAPAQRHLDETADGPEVEVVSLDAWREAAGARLPDLVKIDVEGAEIDVLRGMLGILREGRPRVLCEVHWLGPAFVHFFDTEIRPLGYDMKTIEGASPPTTSDRWHALITPTAA